MTFWSCQPPQTTAFLILVSRVPTIVRKRMSWKEFFFNTISYVFSFCRHWKSITLIKHRTRNSPMFSSASVTACCLVGTVNDDTLNQTLHWIRYVLSILIQPFLCCLCELNFYFRSSNLYLKLRCQL